MDNNESSKILTLNRLGEWGLFPIAFGIIGTVAIEHLLPLSVRLYYTIGFLPIAIFLLLVFFATRCKKSFKITFSNSQSLFSIVLFSFLLSIALSIGSFSIEDHEIPLKEILFIYG